MKGASVNSSPNSRRRLSRVFVSLLIIVGSIFFSEIPSFASDQILPAGTHCHWDLANANGDITVTACSSTTPYVGTYSTTVGTSGPSGDSFFESRTCTSDGSSFSHVNGADTSVHSGNGSFSVTGSTVNIGGSGCSTGQTVRVRGGWVVTGSSEATIESTIGTNLVYTFFFSADSTTLTPPPSVPACTSGIIATGSYVGTTLSIRVQWIAAGSPPSGGFDIYAPDPGTTLPSSPTFNIPLSATVDGSPNTWYGQTTLSTLTPLTAKIVSHFYTGSSYSGDANTCYTVISLSTNQIGTTGTDTGSTDGGTTSTNCSFSLNPFHYIKCLFWPSSSFQQWNDLTNTMKTHAPMSLIYGGVTVVNSTVNGLDSVHGLTEGNSQCQISPCPAITFAGANDASQPDLVNPSTNLGMDPFSQAATFMQTTTWGQIVYKLLALGMAVIMFLWMWNLISASFGSKSAE